MYTKNLKRLYNFLRDERGATAVEYSIMLILIILVVLAVVAVLGEKTSNSFNQFNNKFNQ